LRASRDIPLRKGPAKGEDALFPCDVAMCVSTPHKGEVWVWDLVSGTPPHPVSVGVRVILALSVTGHVLGTSDCERVSLWDLRSGECLYTMTPSLNWHIVDAAFSPDGQLAAAGTELILELYPYDECRETAVL
jgi:WD40 repeat protein